MQYTYGLRGVCPMKVEFNLVEDRVYDIKFYGGCNGNLKAIATLVDGMSLQQLEEKLGGLRCGMKSTSCGDQLVQVVKKAYEEGDR